MTINNLNQMTQRYTGTDFSTGSNGDQWISYTYDANGNLTQAKTETHNGSSWQETLKWVYTWNVRDQMTLAMKYENGSSDNAGSVAYEYCLSCDSAMSRRFVYDGGSGTTQGDLLEGQRFVYDGLTLYRADQIYDDDSNGLSITDEWRVWWENTAMPALLGGHLAKRVYEYPNSTSGTSNGSTDYYYAHDAIGNVITISDSNGARQYHFTQDAFGNELTQDSFNGDSWDTAHNAGIWEHQTGKWLDPETGLYFFHARWVDPVVGRFVGRTTLGRETEGAYIFTENNPVLWTDLDGNMWGLPGWGGGWEFPGPGGRSNGNWNPSVPWWYWENWGDPLNFRGDGAPPNPYARGCYYGACGAAAGAAALGGAEVYCAVASGNGWATGSTYFLPPTKGFFHHWNGTLFGIRNPNFWKGKPWLFDRHPFPGSGGPRWHINPPWGGHWPHDWRFW